MQKSVLVTLIGIAVAGGCSTSSPIQQYGESQSSFRHQTELLSHNFPETDVYRIYHRAATGFVSVQSIRQSAEKRAEDFASRQGKGIVVLGEQISQPPYILGNFPRIEIVFALIDKPIDANPTVRRDKYSDLERLKKLLDQEAITQDEYDREKAKILNE